MVGGVVTGTKSLPAVNNIFRFRWDYFQIYRDNTGHDLEGFKQFIAGGVRSKYLESVFPAESFPAWQTLQTGELRQDHCTATMVNTAVTMATTAVTMVNTAVA